MNFTNTTFQKIPVPVHNSYETEFFSLSFTIQLAQHYFWLTRLLSRTKSRVNQGLGVSYLKGLDL